MKHPEKMALLYEELANHEDGACMAFADGHVRFVPAEDYYSILREAGVEVEVQ
jgi:prepilin-type processing-associated H-X9-DG protein